MDYKKLRDMVSHRTTFEYDSGSKVIGTIAACMPANGPVQMLVLSKVQVLDAGQACHANVQNSHVDVMFLGEFDRCFAEVAVCNAEEFPQIDLNPELIPEIHLDPPPA